MHAMHLFRFLVAHVVWQVDPATELRNVVVGGEDWWKGEDVRFVGL